MAGLVPAIHAAPPQNESGFGPAKGKGLLGKSFAPAARLRAFDAPNRVDGRDKPGHDGLETFAGLLFDRASAPASPKREKHARNGIMAARAGAAMRSTS